MDSLDIRLLRALFPGGVFALSGVDPRPSMQKLARVVGASRVTVRRRLTRWKEGGFWKGLVTFPNPDALGSSFLMQSFTLRHGHDLGRIERSLVDIFEPVFLFQTEQVFNTVLLAEPREASERRQRAFRATGVGRANGPPFDIAFPQSTVRLGPRDWRILRALRKSPDPDWVAVASEVGVTVRGLERRIGRLRAGNALFFFPELDFRRSHGSVTWVGVLFGTGTDTKRLEKELARRYPDLLEIEPIFPIELLLPPSLRSGVAGSFSFFLPVPSASTGDQLRRDIGAVPGVAEVLVGFPTHNSTGSRMLDHRIQAVLEVGG